MLLLKDFFFQFNLLTVLVTFYLPDTIKNHHIHLSVSLAVFLTISIRLSSLIQSCFNKKRVQIEVATNVRVCHAL